MSIIVPDVNEDGSVNVLFKKCHPDAITPTRANPDDAGLDMFALQETFCSRHGTTRVPTGIAVYIPPGYEGQIRPRSSMGLRGVVAIFGSIDSGYVGALSLPTITHFEDYTIKRGERVAQLIINKLPTVKLCEVDELPATTRGNQGFGSSGK